MSESDTHAHAPPPPPEPQTPLWLPAVGAALFIAVGLWWAVTPRAPAPVDADAPAASAPQASAPHAAANAPRPPATPGPAGSAPGGMPDNAALQRILERLPKQ